MFEIEFYEDIKGNHPIENFLDSLDIKMRAKILCELELLSEMGNRMREPYSKHIDEGIFEIRAKVGNNITRILYFFRSGKIIIVVNAFVKKTNKIPRREIILAKKRKKDYIERMGE